jgi:predicted alpha/beta-hydrolase family hydrolase
MASLRDLTLPLDDGAVSGVLLVPEDAGACYVMAHGAGAGMRHPFLEATAAALAVRGIATLRYQFPYMEQRRGRPDTPTVAMATVRAAIGVAAAELPGLPLFAGGKSFGGRMTSELASREPLPGVLGLAFLGFPLHAPKKPDVKRSTHLYQVPIPMLFLQGTRDDLAEMGRMRSVCADLNSGKREAGRGATLHEVEGADHSFHVLKRSGRTDAQVLDELCDTMRQWMSQVGANFPG